MIQRGYQMKTKLVLLTLTLLFSNCQESDKLDSSPEPVFFTGDTLIQVNDIIMFVEAYGSGDAVVLLHGCLGDNSTWDGVIDSFSADYFTIMPESRGQGRTTDSDSSITYHRMAEDAIKLLDLLNIESATFVGFSDGANTALDIAIHHGDRANAIVAYAGNTSPNKLQSSFRMFLESATLASLQANGMITSNYIHSMPDPDRIEIIIEKLRTMLLTEPNFTAAELASVEVPVLVLAGENDEYIVSGHPAEISAAIPGSQLVLLSNAGHNAIFETPVAWMGAVLTFLRDYPS